MILSVINSLKRTMLILNELPQKANDQKKKTISSLNDIFEDFYDQFDKDKDKDTLKKITKLRLEIMDQVENFCNAVSAELQKEIEIVEE